MTRFEKPFGGAVDGGGMGELAGIESPNAQDQSSTSTRDRNVDVEAVVVGRVRLAQSHGRRLSA